MAYEYESDIPKFLKGIESEHPLDLSKEIKEIQEVYRKAKALDEIKEFIIEKLKEEEEETLRTLLSDYDYGLYQAYDNVDDIIQEYLEGE
ncbi:hypothetical protein [Staphylococcus ureilyticus]|uniref:hypothetical protein n=1 Tax=Staphylococcus ureilyticus TaxID=94138 RepID=UPI00321B2A77